MRISRAQQQDPLGELFRLMDHTPFGDVDRDHIRRELDRIKRELSEQLAHKSERLTRAQVRSRRFAQQCEILTLLDWSGASVEAIVPLFRVASIYVLENRPEPGRARIVIQAFRKQRLNREIVL
jgi:hypothetical protein